MKKVCFFCSHPVPTEHPNGVRIANLGLMFQELGYKVYLVGCDNQGERIFDYKGMHCYVYDAIVGAGFALSRRRQEQRLRYVKTFLETVGDIDLIVSAYSNFKAKRFLMHWCKKKRIPMIATVCEWFDRNNFLGVKGFLKLLNNRYYLRCQTPKLKNVIGISTLLCDYYASRGCNTIYIPTLVDMSEYQGLLRQEVDGPLKIAYAGSPAKKDYIANVIRAIALLSDEERKKLCLHLYGATEDQIVSLGIDKHFLEQNRHCVVCHGRIPYAEVKGKIVDADFTILLRPNKRYANAGFPTKVGESMACGTPVIANLTSNLDRYILDGSTGIVCKNETPEACAEALRRALAFTLDERKELRENALKMAIEAFSYTVYCGELNRFVNNLSVM